MQPYAAYPAGAADSLFWLLQICVFVSGRKPPIEGRWGIPTKKGTTPLRGSQTDDLLPVRNLYQIVSWKWAAVGNSDLHLCSCQIASIRSLPIILFVLSEVNLIWMWFKIYIMKASSALYDHPGNMQNILYWMNVLNVELILKAVL